MKQTYRRNYRVNVLFDVAPLTDPLAQTESSTLREFGEELAAAVKRRVDDVHDTSVHYDTTEVCLHCSRPWTEQDDDAEPTCCEWARTRHHAGHPSPRMSPRMLKRSNFRVEAALTPHTACNPDDHRNMLALAREMEQQIHAHVKGISGTVITYDTADECSFCGLPWDELTAQDVAENAELAEAGSIPGEPVCCAPGIDEFRRARGIPLDGAPAELPTTAQEVSA